MSDRERERRAEQSRRDLQQRASFTIQEWCDRRRVSRAMFYVLDAQGLAPKTYRIGRKRCVSDEADAAWLHAREAEAAA